MNRMFGLTLVVGLSLSLNSTAHAQTFLTDYYGQGSYGYGHGDYGYENQPFGGFGFEYTQGPPVSGIGMNQYGQVIGTTYVATSPIVTAGQPAAVQPAARQTTRSRSKIAPVQPRYAVTTGSLAWPGGYGVSGNSQAMRYRSYGYGYELSPYGTTQYFGPWKGWTLGY
jgi:hypothetical protein